MCTIGKRGRESKGIEGVISKISSELYYLRLKISTTTFFKSKIRHTLKCVKKNKKQRNNA